MREPVVAALATDAATLVDYGLDATDANLLTRALRPEFHEVSGPLAKMDRLVLRFRKTEPGARFAAAWKNARIIRDLGQSAPAEDEPAAPTA